MRAQRGDLSAAGSTEPLGDRCRLNGRSPSMPVAELSERHGIIDESATQAGRNPAEIRRLANVNGRITDGATDGFLNGPTEQWIEELSTPSLESRINTFILWTEGELLEQTNKYAEIAGGVREHVAAARR